MSVTDAVSRVESANPSVGVALAWARTDSALFAVLQMGDTSVASSRGAPNDRVPQIDTLLPRWPLNLGQNINTHA